METNGKDARISKLEQEVSMLFQKVDKIVEAGCPLGQHQEKELADLVHTMEGMRQTLDTLRIDTTSALKLQSFVLVAANALLVVAVKFL